MKVGPVDSWPARAGTSPGSVSSIPRWRLLLGGGTTKYVHSIGHPVTNKFGEIIDIIGAATEITDRVYAERALKRSEFYLAEAEKISHTGCWARHPRPENCFGVAGGMAYLRPRSEEDRTLLSNVLKYDSPRRYRPSLEMISTSAVFSLRKAL